LIASQRTFKSLAPQFKCAASTKIRLAALIASLTATPLMPDLARAANPSETEIMQFSGIPPSTPIEVFGNAWTIFADGVIDADSGARLKTFLQERHIPGKSLLYLNSTGGSLIGGMELGRVIRNAELNTHVGRAVGETKKVVAGGCYSSCTLAFLGGEFRYISKDSKYGVHRFYSAVKSDQESDLAQIVSASVVQYTRDMGVDPEFLSEMAKAGKAEINLIPYADLVRLNVVNNGQTKTRWTIESMDEAIYLKGERTTFHGINKFILICNPSRTVTLYAIFDPERREREIINMSAMSLLLDGKPIPIATQRSDGPKLVNGWINVMFSLNDSLLSAIQQAKTVGVSFQFSYDAPLFLGFDGMELGDGARKLPGFLHTCLRQ
jgi:hypothetical protein